MTGGLFVSIPLVSRFHRGLVSWGIFFFLLLPLLRVENEIGKLEDMRTRMTYVSLELDSLEGLRPELPGVEDPLDDRCAAVCRGGAHDCFLNNGNSVI